VNRNAGDFDLHAALLRRFLSFEILPLILERVYYTGNERSRALLSRVAPLIRKSTPSVIIGAYVIPLMHQSSLGRLTAFWLEPRSILFGNRL